MHAKAKFALILCVAGCHAEHPPAVVNDEPTLAILGEDGVTCAAVAITPTLAITANHCVPGHDVPFVTASRTGTADRTALGTVVRREVDSDLALFSASGLVPAVMAPVAIDYEHATTIVTHVPAPWSVTTRRPIDAHAGFLQTARLELGMSGSGLWDDGGRLVGIAVGNDQSTGYFAGRERIERLLAHVPHVAVLDRPEPTDQPAALWGDPNYAVDGLLAVAKRQRARIEAGLDELAHDH
jgi:hypothetical protein